MGDSRFLISHMAQRLGVAPLDEILFLDIMYKEDMRKEKINVGIGTYKDEDYRPVVFDSVKTVGTSPTLYLNLLMQIQAYMRFFSDPNLDLGYLQQSGYVPFVDGATFLVLGKDLYNELKHRTVAVQTLGGTGAIRVGAELMSMLKRDMLVLLPYQTWSNHPGILESLGLEYTTYPYWDSDRKCLDEEGMLSAIRKAPEGSLVVLHSCGHNPTGIDPTEEHWKKIAECVKERHHIAFMDTAYPGLVDGFSKDFNSVRHFINQGITVLVALSLSKCMGLYGERLGCLVIVSPSSEGTEALRTWMYKVTRGLYSTPVKAAAVVASMVLTDPQLRKGWEEQLESHRLRILRLRRKLAERLNEMTIPGKWDHIVKQRGMFSYLGITESQAQSLLKMGVYLTSSGRINISGINNSNIDLFCDKLVKVTEKTPEKKE